ncbi:MAG: flagellar basal body rod protein FlgB [Candidatus Margulisiibacteriota bacterium]|nr:MAG: flagellar basal-body rod protein FlgB [Candidatus Margulisbacteria bacterium GWD2_39_127]OGI05185.1 MAG: flagellar basal-body rod protein FlgB [Candidatus Margulisbacteria bacterium GWF2_38_17]OGI06234.1 MAG: flagellar basal-body rod protein FlgB [Candidatus Margulisbacteria bacterium GWE2_39_32]PZM78890.1 MAG: flagellar basal body rod protein FlgB [Candidatus Margulisiibacteriota bacterium]HAR64528.1 flagellar basal body rod protein FlgB [Candidatus Margulisiibacteriota bacterium]
MDNIVNDGFYSSIERGLDYSTLRQQVLANNIANINTPRFRRSDVAFSKMMKNTGSNDNNFAGIFSTHQNHFSLGDNGNNKTAMFVSQPNDTAFRNDLNNVDINKETSESAKNAIYYQALTQIAARRFRLMKDVIRGR